MSAKRGRGRAWIITGPIGSGKSTVGRLLADCGARHLDADAMVHRLIAKHNDVHVGIRKLFGEGVFGDDGRPDRQRIARQVFDQPELLRHLETLLHPFVLAELAEEAQDWRETRRGLLFMEVVLWYQQETTPFDVDGVLLVWAPRERLMERAAGRSGLDPSEIARRLDSQGDWDSYKGHADRVINTDCDLETLSRRVQTLYRVLSEEEA